MKIDSHQHFWNFDPVRDAWIDDSMQVLRSNFLPDDVLPDMQRHGFAGSIAVQADESMDETKWLLSLAAEYPWIRKVVGWVDLTSAQIDAELDALADYSALAGFRQILQSREPDYIDDPAFRRGIVALGKQNYTYDLLVYPKHLTAARALVADFPAQIFIVDHLGKPEIKEGRIERWALEMYELAKHDNVYCKLSGLVTEANWLTWQEQDLTPYIDVALEAFGPKRLMFGSDWPVCRLAASWDQVVSVTERAIQGLSDAEVALVMGGTASAAYRVF